MVTKKKLQKVKTGRPKGSGSLFSPEIADTIVQKLCEGKTLTSIAKQLGISLYTIYKWKYDPDKEEFRTNFARAMEFGTKVMEFEAVDCADESNIDQETFDQETESGTKRSTKTIDNVARSRLKAEIRMKVVQRRTGKDIRLNADVRSTANVQAELKNVPSDSLEQIRDILLKVGKA